MRQRIEEIIIEKIKKDFKQEVALLVAYDEKVATTNSLQLFYLPMGNGGADLSTQFIIDGYGFDLFPMSWNRLLQVAAMDNPQAYLLKDSRILYVGDQEALEKFTQLKEALEEVMGEEYKEALLNKAFEYFHETSIYLFNMNHLCQTTSDYRIEVAKLLKQLAQVLAFVNQDYYHGGNGSPVSIIEASLSLKELPDNYTNLVKQLVTVMDKNELHSLAKEVVMTTRNFLNDQRTKLAQQEPFSLLFKGYYEEVVKYLNRVEEAIKDGNVFKQFEVLSFVQEELAQFLTKASKGIWFDDRSVYHEYDQTYQELFGLDFMSLVGNESQDHLLQACQEFKGKFETLLKEWEITLNSFDTMEAFGTYMQEK